jgi:hypothetical protein
MAASVRQIDVASEQQLESTISSYIAQGYVVSNRSADSVTLFKKNEFNILWAVIGFFLCLLPLIVYCIVYATQSDEMIIVKLRTGSDAAELTPGGLTWSEDREWWWDGRQWRDALREIPPGAVLSEDGASWWDGETWRKAADAATTAEPHATGEQSSGASTPPSEGSRSEPAA